MREGKTWHAPGFKKQKKMKEIIKQYKRQIDLIIMTKKKRNKKK